MTATQRGTTLWDKGMTLENIRSLVSACVSQRCMYFPHYMAMDLCDFFLLTLINTVKHLGPHGTSHLSGNQLKHANLASHMFEELIVFSIWMKNMHYKIDSSGSEIWQDEPCAKTLWSSQYTAHLWAHSFILMWQVAKLFNSSKHPTVKPMNKLLFIKAKLWKQGFNQSWEKNQ